MVLVANGQRGPAWWPLRVRCGSSTNQVADCPTLDLRRPQASTPPTFTAYWLCRLAALPAAAQSKPPDRQQFGPATRSSKPHADTPPPPPNHRVFAGISHRDEGFDGVDLLSPLEARRRSSVFRCRRRSGVGGVGGARSLARLFRGEARR